MEDVYQALVALCCTSTAMLFIFGALLGAYLCLKIYALYIQLIKKDKNNDKKGNDFDEKN